MLHIKHKFSDIVQGAVVADFMTNKTKHFTKLRDNIETIQSKTNCDINPCGFAMIQHEQFTTIYTRHLVLFWSTHLSLYILTILGV